ncbi:MAG: hypothetical protein JWL73_2474 [Actinomycetia bacterium]|nr:hypothetical protein [Actinomycetes bacterium]
MTTDPGPTVRVLPLDATTACSSASWSAGTIAPALVRVPAADLADPLGTRLAALAVAHPDAQLAVDYAYSAGVALDDRVAALLATIAHGRTAPSVPAVLTLVAPVTLDEQCAAAAYAVAAGVMLVVSDQPSAVERAVRVTTALRAHESVAEPAAR